MAADFSSPAQITTSTFHTVDIILIGDGFAIKVLG